MKTPCENAEPAKMQCPSCQANDLGHEDLACPMCTVSLWLACPACDEGMRRHWERCPACGNSTSQVSGGGVVHRVGESKYDPEPYHAHNGYEGGGGGGGAVVTPSDGGHPYPLSYAQTPTNTNPYANANNGGTGGNSGALHPTAPPTTTAASAMMTLREDELQVR